MSIPVKLEDIIEALEMASDGVTYYLDKRTGQVELISEDISAGMGLEGYDPSDDQPGWLREARSKAREIQEDLDDNFVQIPDKDEIDDYRIMEEFSRTYPNNRVSAALIDAIKDKGAFRRFKSLVEHFSIQSKWSQFQQHAYEEIALGWLEAHKIPYTRGDEIQVDKEM